MDTAKKTLDIIKADNQRRLDEIQTKIEERRQKGLGYSDLEKELEQVQTVAKLWESLNDRAEHGSILS